MKLEVIYASFNTCWFSGTGDKPTSTRNSLWRMDCLFLAGRNARPVWHKLHCILLKTKPWIYFATVIKKEVHIFLTIILWLPVVFVCLSLHLFCCFYFGLLFGIHVSCYGVLHCWLLLIISTSTLWVHTAVKLSRPYAVNVICTMELSF